MKNQFDIGQYITYNQIFEAQIIDCGPIGYTIQRLSDGEQFNVYEDRLSPLRNERLNLI